jgi:cation:H+ antiporter
VRLNLIAKLAAGWSSATGAAGAALSALWTFPSILGSAFLIAWAAEAAQFLVSQGLALAILAWLQTLPEFAVEAVIAWEAGKDPERSHLAIANLTGAIRLLLGLGWPMIYFVFAYFGRHGDAKGLPAIKLAPEHSVEVVGLVPPLLYFFWIWNKQSINLFDAGVLLTLYVAYLWVLSRCPPHDAEQVADAPAVSRWAYGQRGWRRPAAIGGLFATGGLILYATAHPFLESMLAIAAALGISQFFLVQWVAPLLSEFPEKISAFYWARRVTHAPMALMNMVSSNINQWTVLAAMIPIVYGLSTNEHTGAVQAFRFDDEQQAEILLTLLQSLLAMLLLANLEFSAFDAGSIFLLWIIQFVYPPSRELVTYLYLAWILILVGLFATRTRRLAAPREFWRVFRASPRAKTTADITKR